MSTIFRKSVYYNESLKKLNIKLHVGGKDAKRNKMTKGRRLAALLAHERNSTPKLSLAKMKAPPASLASPTTICSSDRSFLLVGHI